MAEKSKGARGTARDYTAADVEELCKEITMRVMLPNGAPFTFSIEDAAAVNPDDIQAELARHSARYAFYARLVVETKISVRDQGRVVDDLETAADMRVRAELESQLEPGPRGGVKSPSETEIKRRISLDERVVAARRKRDDLVAQEERLNTVREALSHRRDMLSAIAMYRAPEGTDPARRASYKIQK